MHRQKVKLLLGFATLLSILALVVVPALATEAFTLTVEKAGDGTGTVTSDPPGIDCGEVCEATFCYCSPGKLKDTGVEVILTAVPDAGFAFAGWGRDCQCALDSPSSGAGFAPETCRIIGQLGESRTCTANFGLPVGGTAVPVSKLGLLAPWIGLAALASLAVSGVVLVRRRKGV